MAFRHNLNKSELFAMEVQWKTGAEVVYNGIVARNLRTAPFVSFRLTIPLETFGTSLFVNFGDANFLKTADMFIERQLADILRSDISIEIVPITPMEFSQLSYPGQRGTRVA